MPHDAPILDFDGSTEAILEPSKLITPLPGMPSSGVITFFQDVIDHFVAAGQATEIYALKSEMGRPQPLVERKASPMSRTRTRPSPTAQEIHAP